MSKKFLCVGSNREFFITETPHPTQHVVCEVQIKCGSCSTHLAQAMSLQKELETCSGPTLVLKDKIKEVIVAFQEAYYPDLDKDTRLGDKQLHWNMFVEKISNLGKDIGIDPPKRETGSPIFL